MGERERESERESETGDAGGMLGCPECDGYPSFTILEIEGWQQKAQFAENGDGNRYCTHASTTHVTGFNEERLRCNSCGAVVAKDELIRADP